MTRKIRPIRIEGNIAYVPLTKGYEAVIDAADVPLVEGYNWYANVSSRQVYAERTDKSDVNFRRISLHRVIMGDPDGLQIDHIDCNGLNNKRSNLREATNSQNQYNARTRVDNSSGFKGVHWHSQKNKWRARIKFKGKNKSLGLFETPEQAHEAYAKASAELHGEFGRTESRRTDK